MKAFWKDLGLIIKFYNLGTNVTESLMAGSEYRSIIAADMTQVVTKPKQVPFHEWSKCASLAAGSLIASRVNKGVTDMPSVDALRGHFENHLAAHHREVWKAVAEQRSRPLS